MNEYQFDVKMLSSENYDGMVEKEFDATNTEPLYVIYKFYMMAASMQAPSITKEQI